MRKPYCFCTKKIKQTRKYICKHESSSKGVKVVANIHVSLEFCGKAALSEASEEKIQFEPCFTKKILKVGLIVKFYKPYSQ